MNYQLTDLAIDKVAKEENPHRIQIFVGDDTISMAKKIGAGNVSLAVRMAVKAVYTENFGAYVKVKGE